MSDGIGMNHEGMKFSLVSRELIADSIEAVVHAHAYDGLIAFGRSKRVICMDGHDLSEALRREIPLNHVLERKVRRAAETGLPFTPVGSLFTE